ncbi:MAG: STAS domain-containing protein [Pseudomonadota bacterium]
MGIEVARSDDVLNVILPGPRLDAAAVPVFKQYMQDAMARHAGDIVLNLRHVDFIDSSGLGAIVGLARRVATGRQVVIQEVRPAVMRLFRLTRVDSVLKVREAAVAGDNG